MTRMIGAERRQARLASAAALHAQRQPRRELMTFVTRLYARQPPFDVREI
jgi:hypothetical protein